MKKIYTLLLFCCLWNFSQAQVTEIHTDFNDYWVSGVGAINPIRPNLSHNLLAFKWNGTLYSTGVNNAKLAANGVVLTAAGETKFRALPITTVPVDGNNTYYIAFGALQDGIAAATSPTFINPPITTGIQKASYLTRGIQGLDLGTGLANIPGGLGGAILTFNLSAKGVTEDNVGDGIPDILVSQIAEPTSSSPDKLYFLDDNNVRVGDEVSIVMNDLTKYPILANWNADFYNNNSSAGITNTGKQISFFAVDLATFGITKGPGGNASQVRKLVYVPGGTSDPAFLAFNEPSLGIATQLKITQQPTESNCDGTMPSSFTVSIQDFFDFPVEQEGYEITAYMESGPGLLIGTIKATTNAQGIATFNNLRFEVGGNHTIRFENTSLQPAISNVIAGPEDCEDNLWTGAVNTNWNNTGNWNLPSIPNANDNVTIPTGAPRYPVLTANAGAKNLIMGENATININGHLFTIKGDITTTATSKVNAGTVGSILYMSGTAAQTIPSGFLLNNNINNFTVENAAGVTTNTLMNLTGVVRIFSGNFETNGNLTLACSFSPQKTGQIGKVDGSITGNVVAEQCFPARRAFRLVSSSVTTANSIHANWQEGAAAYNNNPNPGYGTHITGSGIKSATPVTNPNGFDWQPSGAASMFVHNNVNQTWSGIDNTNANNLVAGAPYRLMVRGDRTIDISKNATLPTNTKLRSTGTVVTGNHTVTGLSAAAEGFSFVGNPYHAVVDMNLVLGNSTNLTNFYFIWDPKAGGANPIVGEAGGRGAFVTVNTITGISTLASGTTQANRYLQPYQAFFVQTAAAGTPILTFTENDKAVSQTQTAVFRQSMRPYLGLSLYYKEAFETESTATDGLRIDFYNDGNNDVDVNDAPKFTNLDENISRLVGEQYISMESRNIAQADEELPIAISQYRKSDYVLQVEVGSFEGLEVYLKDNYLNKETLLENEVNAVNFSVNDDEASKNSDRFAVVFKTKALNIDKVLANNQFTLYPNPLTGSELYINSSASYQNAEVVIYNALGQKVYNTSAVFNSNNQISVKVNSLESGIYILKLKTGSGVTYNAKFIKK